MKRTYNNYFLLNTSETTNKNIFSELFLNIHWTMFSRKINKPIKYNIARIIYFLLNTSENIFIFMYFRANEIYSKCLKKEELLI